jgi:hypothetical protein
MSAKRLLVIGISVFVFSSSVFSQEGLQVGAVAPDFALPTAGTKRTVALQEYVKKSIVIVHFWKTK